MKCKTLRKPMAEEVKRLAVRTLEYRYHLDEKKAVIILLRVSFNENVSDGNKLTTVRSSDVIQLALTLKVIRGDYRTGCRNVSHCQQQS